MRAADAGSIDRSLLTQIQETLAGRGDAIDLGCATYSGRRSDEARDLLRVTLSHLVLVCGKCSQNLSLLALGHVEGVERSPKFGRDFIELGG